MNAEKILNDADVIVRYFTNTLNHQDEFLKYKGMDIKDFDVMSPDQQKALNMEWRKWDEKRKATN